MENLTIGTGYNMSNNYKNNNGDQLQIEFVRYIRSLVEYWENTDRDSRGKLDGLAFSILAMLDGCDPECRNYLLAASDYPKFDITGNLHDLYYNE